MMTNTPPTLRWSGGPDGHLLLLDQTMLPGQVIEKDCHTVDDVWEAIRSLRIRGAPAIGVAAAYGVVLGARQAILDGDAVAPSVLAAAGYLATSRPTAVNLFWSLDRMREMAGSLPTEVAPLECVERLLAEAKTIHDEDRRQCAEIGRHGRQLLDALPDDCGLLTHCNAGSLATGGEGTALAVIFALHAAGKPIHLFADETRPLLQGARLTAWELQQRGIDVTLICDSMAAPVMREGRVQAVVVGADRIAANGDTANKIGTYSLAIAATAHDVPFYVAAPTSTFDLSLPNGDAIPIEQRPMNEITHLAEQRIAPEGVAVYNPAFDVTPARLIRAIICEQGIIEPVTADGMIRMTGGSTLPNG